MLLESLFRGLRCVTYIDTGFILGWIIVWVLFFEFAILKDVFLEVYNIEIVQFTLVSLPLGQDAIPHSCR
jgi:hypothetical protein